MRDRQHLITLHKKARKAGFDMNQYNTLKEELASVTADLEKLRDQGVWKVSNVYAASGRGGETQDFTKSDNSVLDIVKEYYASMLKKKKSQV